MTDYEKEVIKELTNALQTLVDQYIANRGTEHEFITCITPDKKPWYWLRAEQALEKGKECLEVKNDKKK